MIVERTRRGGSVRVVVIIEHLEAFEKMKIVIRLGV
jgi:hypothetical protein